MTDDDEFAELRRAVETDQHFGIVLIPVSDFERMIEASDEGDQAARRCMLAFAAWSKRIDAEAEAGNHPACFQCEMPVVSVEDGGNGIGGIAIVSPLGAGGAPQANGLVAVYCPMCASFSREHLMTKLRASIAQESGMDVFDLH
jgi:hypothetical protein